MKSDIHARRRAKERYGIKLTRNVTSAIILDIQRGRSHNISNGRHLTQIHSVRVGDRVVRVVYCPRNKKIVTILTRPHTLEIAEGQE